VADTKKKGKKFSLIEALVREQGKSSQETFGKNVLIIKKKKKKKKK